jgi:hypothetical protein
MNTKMRVMKSVYYRYLTEDDLKNTAEFRKALEKDWNSDPEFRKQRTGLLNLFRNMELLENHPVKEKLFGKADRSYMQKIQQCKVTLHNRELTIEVVSKADLDLEEWTFASKVLMMEEVYGFKVRLERVESL